MPVGLAAPDLLAQFGKTLVKDHVDIIEFAESDKYCGMKLYPRQKTLLKIVFLMDLNDYDWKVIREWEAPGGEVTISPKLEWRMEYLRQHNFKHFRTMQLVGGRRSGKGFVTGLAIAYQLYQLVQQDSPGDHYGIDRNKDIYFSIVADSLDQAKAHQFGDAVNWVLECKPLREDQLLNKVLAETISVYSPYDKRNMAALAAAGTKPDRDLASLKVKAFGTNSKTIRGSASIMFIFDEMAHLIAGESRMSDEELYKASIPSLAQFRQDAMIMANSSPYTKTGKFFELYEQALQLDPPEDGNPVYPDHFMLQMPSWELYKDWETEGKKFIGAVILDPDEDPILAREELADPETFKVEYRAQFAEVIDAFLRPEMVDRMFDPSWNKGVLGHTPKPTAGTTAMWTSYKAHADPSSVDANFGIAVAHIEPVKNEDTGALEKHVVFDFIDAFYPEDFEEHTIDWMEVIPAIVTIINNFRPYEFTFDQFDSTMPIQEINKRIRGMGIGETNVHEITATAPRNLRRAKNFKAAVNLGRVHAPHPDTFGGSGKNSIDLVRTELKFLQMKNGRVEKQTIGPVQTKDIADCMMECVDALIGDSIINMQEELENATMAFGSPGGYRIGGQGNTGSFEEMKEIYPALKGQPLFVPGRGIRRNPRH